MIEAPPPYYELELQYQEQLWNRLTQAATADDRWTLAIAIRESTIRAKYIDRKLHTKRLDLDQYLDACRQIEVQQPITKIPSDHPRRAFTLRNRSETIEEPFKVITR